MFSCYKNDKIYAYYTADDLMHKFQVPKSLTTPEEIDRKLSRLFEVATICFNGRPVIYLQCTQQMPDGMYEVIFELIQKSDK